MRRLGYRPALDGLRGVAILAVTLYHFFGLSGGFYGVDLFFVLSGFLITSLLVEEHAATGRIELGAFYRRRARRLLPALAFLLLIVFPFSWKLALQGGLYVSNFYRAFATPDPLSSQPLDHLWSLAEEEQFYLVWPLALVVLLRHGTHLARWLAVVFIALTVYRVGLAVDGAEARRLYYAPDTHATGLVLGCLAAVARPRIRRLYPLAVAVAIVWFAVGATTVAWETAGLPVFELAAAVLVVAAAEDGLPFLAWKPLVSVGVVSYGLYLWQQPARWLFRWHQPWPALPLAVILTLVSYRWVEQPFRRPRTTRTREAAIPEPGT